MRKSALLLVDLQKYYHDPHGSFYRYAENLSPGCMSYIDSRLDDVVLPNVMQLLRHFRERELPVIYLRLCSESPDRSDLHPFFRRSHYEALEAGFNGIYPLADHPESAIIEEISPFQGEYQIIKKGFSGFTNPELSDLLSRLNANHLTVCGLATSQCVESTCRSASDLGYSITRIEDAMADYDDISHRASLFSSAASCGPDIISTSEFLDTYPSRAKAG